MQIFPRSSNAIARASMALTLFVVGGLFWGLVQIERSPYITYAGVRKSQPVPFSHQHHVTGLGIDCRYCHTSVEQSSFAGIPPTKTCINCHAQIWTNAAYLEPVRESFRTGRSIEWTRVNQLPNYVYFNHSIHVSKGVGCNTCHGPGKQVGPDYKSITDHTHHAVSSAGSQCINCHMPNGLGQPGQTPPLAGSEWVDGAEFNEKRIVGIVLKGLKGPVTVKGANFNSPNMQPWEAIGPKKIAAVLTYVRQEWGNKGGEITEAQVVAAKKEFSSHGDQWTIEEIKQIPLDAYTSNRYAKLVSVDYASVTREVLNHVR